MNIVLEVVSEPYIVSDRIKAFLDDPQWPKHIQDPQLKHIKMMNMSLTFRFT